MNTLLTWYRNQTNSGELVFDLYQRDILQQLDMFISDFNRQHTLINRIEKLFYRNNHSFGIYLYGDVGRGKSMILNQMYTQITRCKKIRLHFHQFMDDIHHKLNLFKYDDQPLKSIAIDIKKKYEIIFLDELHVSDIATAMILKNLLMNLFDQNIYIVTSSNYAPDRLYLDGLMRERFLSAIDLINSKLQILSLNSPTDYRGLYDSYNQFFIINDHHAKDKLNKLFGQIAGNGEHNSDNTILIQNRSIDIIARGADVIWLDFKTICGSNRSQLDYLELASKFNYFIIENIFAMTENEKDTARRFTWLVDILYDQHKKLILSINCQLNQIYPYGDFAIEFTRTISRLTEMQTSQYLNHNNNIESMSL